jgi:hypothetical protein
MAFRYTDLDKKISNYSDFINRRRFPTLLELFVICVGVIIFGVGVSLSVKDTIALCSILFTCVGAMTCYTITQLNRSRDLLQATEFENALFASAMNLHHAFSFIVKRDGAVVYCSPGVKDLFAEFTEAGGSDLKTWIEHVRMPAEASSAIFKAIEGSSEEELVCHLFGNNEHRDPYRIRIDAIPRPKGFFLIRCREDAVA